MGIAIAGRSGTITNSKMHQPSAKIKVKVQVRGWKDIIRRGVHDS